MKYMVVNEEGRTAFEDAEGKPEIYASEKEADKALFILKCNGRTGQYKKVCYYK